MRTLGQELPLGRASYQGQDWPLIFSPIKFQADMGLMLTIMFLWSMLGAEAGLRIGALIEHVPAATEVFDRVTVASL